MPLSKSVDSDPLSTLEEKAHFLDKTLHSLQPTGAGTVGTIRDRLAVMRDGLRRVQAARERLKESPDPVTEALLVYEWESLNMRCQELNRIILDTVPSLINGIPSMDRAQ